MFLLVNLKEDLDGLAALIELCDLVVSTSNVTIHMAGALGKASWVLLPFAATFWWLIERTDSLWYPTVKLYRQKSLQDWSEVLENTKAQLKIEAINGFQIGFKVSNKIENYYLFFAVISPTFTKGYFYIYGCPTS